MRRGLGWFCPPRYAQIPQSLGRASWTQQQSRCTVVYMPEYFGKAIVFIIYLCSAYAIFMLRVDRNRQLPPQDKSFWFQYKLQCTAALLHAGRFQDLVMHYTTWHVLTRVSLTSDSLGTYAFCLICWIDTVSRSGRGIAASTASECSSSGIGMARFSTQVRIGSTSGSYLYNTGEIFPSSAKMYQSLSGHPRCMEVQEPVSL